MTLNENLEYMLDHVSSDYDTSAGSFFYDLLYPVAARVSGIQSAISDLETNAFAVTASGEYLDRKVAEQGITRRSATYATGTARIYGDRGEIVRAGSKIATDNILFAVDEAAAIPEEGYVDVAITCVTAGAAGNVKAGEINRFPVTLPGLSAVSNTDATVGGYDEESDYDLLERYLEKVSRPNVSGNKNHYIEWAKEIARIGSVQVFPLWDGPGTVKVVITGSDNLPIEDESLIEKVRQHIEVSRPIGANVTVISASSCMINVSLKLISNGASTIQSDIEEAIKKYLAAVALDKGYVSYAKIGSLILSVDGTEDYSELRVNEGTENIVMEDGVIPVLGTVVIT